MYVVRVHAPAQGPPLFVYSKPCVRCLETLLRCGVRRVYYTTGAGADEHAESHAQPACLAFEGWTVRDLLAREVQDGGGHVSRGDRAAAASMATGGDGCAGRMAA